MKGDEMIERVRLRIGETAGLDRVRWPVTRGIPLPKGAMVDPGQVRIEDADGQGVPAQFRVLSRWPDGSAKWVLADFQADVPGGGEAAYWFCYGALDDDDGRRTMGKAVRSSESGVRKGKSEKATMDDGKKQASLSRRGQMPGGGQRQVEPEVGICVEETEDRIAVCTGPLRFAVNRKRFSFLESVELGQVRDGAFVCEQQVEAGDGDAWVGICESFHDEEGRRFLYGMGGDCRASLAAEDYEVQVEEAGPLRVVIRCAGAFEADVPMHHYAGYRPFRFVIRVYAYAGQATVRVLFTAVAACNPRETEVEEIALRVPFPSGESVRYQVAEGAGDLRAGEGVTLWQPAHNFFRLEARSGERVRTVREGERAQGWLTVADERVGVGVGLRYMAEEYPKALGASRDGIDVFCWRDPGKKRLSLKRYAEAVSWGEGEGVYADGTGTAKTSELFVHYFRAEEMGGVPDHLRGWLDGPHVALDPSWAARCAVTGGFAPFDPDQFRASEQMMTGFLDWLERNITLGGWYGFLDWGDALVAWDAAMGDWKFSGRWGWCNSEWDPRHGVWIQYLRTGDARYFRLGEAMTRHSMDVDTCHFHPFRPYMVGGCFRHSVDHFGDEPCASHTFVDNWVDYYYLTGDLRTREVLREAGAFLMRYRWTEDPAFSFSLRSIANVLRGLLHVYEVTGEARFFRRAEEVYEVIARGQNEDGSWHKRFHIATPDRLPTRAPYGMATEGCTLAVEMGTAPPFSEAEFLSLRGGKGPMIRVVPVEEQKGYQTHYLMVGLELFHRMTGREDVAEVYRRAVDWFCGFPEALNEEAAIAQRYGGIVCRHLGYAWHLTGNRDYLEMGLGVLQQVIHDQDRGSDPKQRGAVGLSPMYISLLFWGVPYLLGTLGEE